jgi:hypothetical protein
MQQKIEPTIIIFTLMICLSTLLSCIKDNAGTGTNEPSIVYPINESDADYVFEKSTVTYITYLADNIVSIVGEGASAQNGKVTISRAGNYSITGTTADGQILVDTKDLETVKIELNGVNIISKSSSAIYVKAASKLVILLAENSANFLSDATSYVFDDKAAQEPLGTIFSKEDLSIYGSGTLDVTGNAQDGIVSKDGLIIKSGTIKVSAKDDAIRGKNYVIIRNGTLSLTAKQDGLKSSGLAEDGLGFIIIDNGSIDISAGDDGIHAEYYITINSGNINVKNSNEAIEARRITVNNGNISINAKNDGFNCSDGLDNSSNALTLNINGGFLVARVSGGDVYDSNGTINITGGTIISHGPVKGDGEALDHDGELNITGGTFVGTGGQIRADFMGSKSTQNILAMSFNASTAAQKPLVRLKRADSKDVVVFQVENGLQSFVYSAPDLTKSSYEFLSGGTLISGSNTDGMITEGVVTGGTKLKDVQINGLVTILK